MASSMEQCMRTDPQLLSERLTAFVRQRADAKTLARLIGCDVRTAENIRRGHWPIARHWAGLVATFGRDLTDAVFHPSAAAARLEAEVRELEQQLADRRAALRDVARHQGGMSEDLAPGQRSTRPAVTDAHV
jgi:hypothetical protein